MPASPAPRRGLVLSLESERLVKGLESLFLAHREAFEALAAQYLGAEPLRVKLMVLAIQGSRVFRELRQDPAALKAVTLRLLQTHGPETVRRILSRLGLPEALLDA